MIERTFGTREEGLVYEPRPAAYVVVIAGDTRVAAVRGAQALFLPGGGALRDETPEETVAREVAEELGCGIRIARRLCGAVQYFATASRAHRMTARFFIGEFRGEPGREGEHELLWIEPGNGSLGFFHERHEWAVREALSNLPGQPLQPDETRPRDSP
jgi:8-oxo-dGTP pyrophosphatase MutT (NUDIX family)